LDATDHGWAGRLVVGAMTTPRLPLTLYPTIDIPAFYILRTARVEAIVESERGEDGNLIPKRIHIVRLHD
jgi:hypothetical protein